MAYTKYSLTPADNNAAPPNGAPEGMLPSAVNETMRDMMSQIRDVGDGIRGGTYTMTAPVITGGSINGTTVGAGTASTGAFTTLSATGNVSFDGGSFVFNEAGADKDARFEGDTDANLLFLDASTDRIGIGTSSPTQKLEVVGTIRSTGTSANNGATATTGAATIAISSDARIWSIQSSNADSALRFRDETSGAERMRIDSSGSLLIGTTATPSASVYGSVFLAASESRRVLLMSGSSTATSARIEFFNPNGQVGKIETSGSNTTYGTSSDYRLKENIAPMTGALAKVSQLKPCTYTWKADGVAGQGFIAHELQSVVPDAVSGEKDAVNEDGTIKAQGIDTSFLVATLTAAIQELKATVDAQAARIAALESK